MAAADKGVQARNKYVEEAGASKQKWADRKAQVDAEVEKHRKEKEAADGAQGGSRSQQSRAVAALGNLHNHCFCVVAAVTVAPGSRKHKYASTLHCLLILLSLCHLPPSPAWPFSRQEQAGRGAAQAAGPQAGA